MKNHKRAKKDNLSLGTRDIAFIVRSDGKPEIHVPIVGLTAAAVPGLFVVIKAAVVLVDGQEGER